MRVENRFRRLITSLRGSCSAPTTHTPTDRPWEVRVAMAASARLRRSRSGW